MADRSLTRLVVGGALIAGGLAAIVTSAMAIQTPWLRWWALQAFNTLDEDATPAQLAAVRERLEKADGLSAAVDPDLKLALADIAISLSQPHKPTQAAANGANAQPDATASTGTTPATATETPPALTPAQMEAERLKARALLRSILHVRPGDAIAWYNLATVEQGAGPLSPAGHRAFAMSIRTGRAVGQLVFPRLTFCGSYWTQLDVTEQTACREQVRLATGPLAEAWPDYFAALPSEARQLLEPVFKASGATLPALNADGTLAAPAPAGSTAADATNGASPPAAPTSETVAAEPARQGGQTPAPSQGSVEAK